MKEHANFVKWSMEHILTTPYLNHPTMKMPLDLSVNPLQDRQGKSVDFTALQNNTVWTKDVVGHRLKQTVSNRGVISKQQKLRRNRQQNRQQRKIQRSHQQPHQPGLLVHFLISKSKFFPVFCSLRCDKDPNMEF